MQLAPPPLFARSRRSPVRLPRVIGSSLGERPAEKGGPEIREITLSRTIRRQLGALVSAFEELSGFSVGSDFSVSLEPPDRIALHSSGHRVKLPAGSGAHRLARAAIIGFHSPGSAHPASGFNRGEACFLSVSQAGIVFTQGS
jgi:hypothetical protein